MNISAINCSVNFGRRLSKDEKKEFLELQKEARSEKNLDIGNTTATIFDFSIPKSKNDTGIGTSFSEDALDMALFLKTMCGINSIQLQPQGQISNYVHSPYSGTNFSLGMHIIDMNKLTTKEYGNLLTDDDLNNAPYISKQKDENKVDYDNIFQKNGGQKELLKKAYDNFMKLDDESELKTDFKRFKESEENEYWLEKDALYEAAAYLYDSEDINTWDDKDKYLFKTKEGNQDRIEELKLVEDEENRNIVDFEEFIQFIADKQQKESKENFNRHGIEIMGDCQIGFSQKDFWAHRSAFYDDLEFGCYNDKTKDYNCWSPAIDFDKLDSDAGELLYNKFDVMCKRYDGLRIDAAWQLVNPLLLTPRKDEVTKQDKFDSKGNKLGDCSDCHPHAEDKIIKGIALKVAEKNGIKPNKILLEMLGSNARPALPYVKDSGMQFIHITKYANNNWGRVNYYEASGDSVYQNMKPGDYTIGPGTHDDESLIAQFDTCHKQKTPNLKSDLHLEDTDMGNRSNWTNAVFAELFTTKNQFVTLPDILGSERRINIPNEKEGNWEYRANSNYQEEYFDNLSKGRGLNLPDALSKALKAAGRESSLTERLDKYANILREKESDNKKINITS